MNQKFVTPKPKEIETRLYSNQQAVEGHISKITQLQRMIEEEEEELSVKIAQSQKMVAALLNKFVTEH
jgi:hypothetical protein